MKIDETHALPETTVPQDALRTIVDTAHALEVAALTPLLDNARRRPRAEDPDKVWEAWDQPGTGRDFDDDAGRRVEATCGISGLVETLYRLDGRPRVVMTDSEGMPVVLPSGSFAPLKPYAANQPHSAAPVREDEVPAGEALRILWDTAYTAMLEMDRDRHDIRDHLPDGDISQQEWEVWQAWAKLRQRSVNLRHTTLSQILYMVRRLDSIGFDHGGPTEDEKAQRMVWDRARMVLDVKTRAARREQEDGIREFVRPASFVRPTAAV